MGDGCWRRNIYLDNDREFVSALLMPLLLCVFKPYTCPFLVATVVTL